jgi:hypothetical protein
VIRQAISCDICGTEKKQTNHWFVAYEYGGELRVSGWSSRNRLRPGSKHLCGQTCLHKLVDEFMAKALAERVLPAAAEEPEVAAQAARADASLTSDAAYVEVESSARLITPTVVAAPQRVLPRSPVELVTLPVRLPAKDSTPAPIEAPRYASRNWRAEAWERERQRASHAGDHHPEIVPRRRANS